MTEYLTLKTENNDEFTVKHSRFIGYAKPVQTQEEAVAFINEIKSKHWDAKHNVYAYILREGQTRRYSDDGADALPTELAGHNIKFKWWRLSSVGRASALQAEGQRFEPVNLHH